MLFLRVLRKHHIICNYPMSINMISVIRHLMTDIPSTDGMILHRFKPPYIVILMDVLRLSGKGNHILMPLLTGGVPRFCNKDLNIFKIKWQTDKVYSSGKIGSMKLKNRFIKAATATESTNAKGKILPHGLELYGNWSRGGVGLIDTGAMAVSPGFLGRDLRVNQREIDSFIEVLDESTP